MIRLTLALAAGAGAAWGQTPLIDLGKVQGGGAPPTLTISDECKAIPKFSGASACICPDGHMIDVGQHCSDTSRPTRTYTPADLDRLRVLVTDVLLRRDPNVTILEDGAPICGHLDHATQKFAGGMTCSAPSVAEIEAGLAIAKAAGISPEALEAKAREGK